MEKLPERQRPTSKVEATTQPTLIVPSVPVAEGPPPRSTSVNNYVDPPPALASHSRSMEPPGPTPSPAISGQLISKDAFN